MSDEKYLNPKTNPFIPDYEESEPLKPEEPGADGLAPMIDLDLTADALAEKIEAAYPGQNEIEAGQLGLLQKMASGNWTLKNTGQAISELGLPDLMKLDDFLKDRQKG